jgi:hypothetical protein
MGSGNVDQESSTLPDVMARTPRPMLLLLTLCSLAASVRSLPSMMHCEIALCNRSDLVRRLVGGASIFALLYNTARFV